MYKKLIYKYIAVCKLNCNHNKIFGATTELVEAIYQNYFKTMLEYIYAYTYTHIHIHTYIHIHLHTYIHILLFPIHTRICNKFFGVKLNRNRFISNIKFMF